MNFWFLIWVFLSVFLTGIFLWSWQILIKQKQVWKQFGQKYKLDVNSVALLKSPVISGIYKGFPLQIFSEQQATEDQRGRRFRTIIQFELPAGMPVEGVVASRKFHSFANNLQDLVHSFRPDAADWPQELLVRSRDVSLLQPYFTPARCNSLIAVMTIKTFNALFIFDQRSTFLRLESPDPFHDLGRLERICAKIEEHARVLSVK